MGAPADAIDPLVEQRRFVWNARGAVDIVKLGGRTVVHDGRAGCRPYMKNLDRVLRSLDEPD